jgi:DNA-binding NarL/FixJ family response regulator
MLGVTDRQLQYVRMKCNGLSDTEVAEECGVSRATVWSTVQRFYKHIGANGMTSPDTFTCYVLGTIDERRRTDRETSLADTLLRITD